MATDADINAETKCKGEEPSPGPGHLSPWPSPLKGRGEVTFHVSVSILASFQLIPTYSSLFQRIFFRTHLMNHRVTEKIYSQEQTV